MEDGRANGVSIAGSPSRDPLLPQIARLGHREASLASASSKGLLGVVLVRFRSNYAASRGRKTQRSDEVDLC